MTDTLKSRIGSGEPLLGTFVKTPSPNIIEALGRSDLDFLCLDAEHAPFGRGELDMCLLAARSVGMPAVVRLPSANGEHILNVLDLGADGFVAPHMKTADEAQYVVDKSLYHRGRGFAGGTRSAGAKGLETHIKDSNDSVTVIGQIEDKDALDHLDDILSVDGIDCFFIGRSDLTVSMGLTDRDAPEVLSTIEHICTRAREHGRITGTFTTNFDEIPHWRSLGVSLFILGSDQGLMLNGVKHMTDQVKALF